MEPLIHPDIGNGQALVSVVLPTYNRAHCLARAIRSVLAQTWDNFELIVIDDGSVDDTQKVVSAIGDPRVKYLRLDKNSGASAARNYGIGVARGPWIAFQDSDDEWTVDKLALQMQAAHRPGEDYSLVACCTRCPEDSSFSFDPLPELSEVSDATNLAVQRLPGAPCWLVRREALLQAGLFDDELNCFEDWDLALKLSRFSRIALLNRSLHINHRSPGSLFANEAGYVRNLTRILQRHQDLWAQAPRDLAVYQTLIGHMACLHGDAAEGRRWFRQAIAGAPLAPRPWFSLAVSLLGRQVYRTVTTALRDRRRTSQARLLKAVF